MSLVNPQTATGKLLICCLLFFSLSLNLIGQTLPSERTVNWSLAGFRGELPVSDNLLNILDFGGIPDGTADNSNALTNALTELGASPGVLFFPAGNYLFHSNITLTEGVILQGAGAEQTTLSFDLGGTDDLIQIKGSATNVFSDFTENAYKSNIEIQVEDATAINTGDYIRIIQDDSNLVFSNWAIGTVGQIIRITAINGNTLLLDSELRKDFLLEDHPKIQKLDMIENVGVTCLKVSRLDETNPIQTSNIKFQYAAQCWIQGLESENCNFAHINIEGSSNISVTGSFFHDAFDYGGGGRAYGVMIQSTGNENLIDNNVFEHLRHAMIVQSGANGNIFAYNYSIDPFWTGTTLPSNAAGDLVCHGNFPYANLFEGNIGQQIVIDNSHGSNGPYNTFIRNRAELYGIVMSANNSPSQNFLGNEIPNGTPGAVGFYFLQGADHFESGNNLGGDILPEGTDASSIASCYLTAAPSFFNQSVFPNIGMPNIINSGSIPGEERRLLNENITVCAPSCTNSDQDNICDLEDNCPSLSNTLQEDTDEDGIGNACDNCIHTSNTLQVDTDGDGIGDACDSFASNPEDLATDNENVLLENWAIYPNPASNELFINLKSFTGQEKTVRIYNGLGQLALQKETDSVSNQPFRISLDELPLGVYFVQINLEKGRTLSKQFSIISQ